MKRSARKLSVFTVPNIMTGARIVISWIAIGGIAITYRKNEIMHLLFCVMYGLGYIIDLFDGIAARRLKQESEFGKIFDPASDKIVAVTMLLFLYVKGIFPLWALAVVLFRDVVLSTLRLVSQRYSLYFKTSNLGKYRSNIIGYGCGLLYLWHYMLNPGNSYAVIHYGIHGFLVIVALLSGLNVFVKSDKFLMGMFETFEAKLVAAITLVIGAINPAWGIPAAIAWITMATLVDYGLIFSRTLNKTIKSIKTPDFLWRSAGQLFLALVITSCIPLLVRETLAGAIIAANVTFIVLLWRNAVYILKNQPLTTS